MPTKTTKFGTSKREGHDASDFYKRNLYAENGSAENGAAENGAAENGKEALQRVPSDEVKSADPVQENGKWRDQIYHHSAVSMTHVPDNSVGLAFTSPPYNVGKQYDTDLDMKDYLSLIEQVGREVHRVLLPGGRYVVNIANLGRKPYIPLHALFYEVHQRIGFLPMGEIIWQKGKGASGSCAWGSWMSAKAPRLRDLHEYLLVFSKDTFARPDKGQSDISREEFMQSTLSIWEIPPESAKRVGHPAPFPLALAERVIKLYSYVDDVVLDPFSGSGTTCLAAKQARRHYVGYEVAEEYCRLAEKRLDESTGRIERSEVE